MKRIFWTLLCFTAVCIVHVRSAGAVSSFTDGNQLFGECTTDPNMCTGYITGVVDGFQAENVIAPGPGQGVLVCLPQTATVHEVSDAVIGYLAAHPDQRQYIAASLVLVALEGAFPC